VGADRDDEASLLYYCATSPKRFWLGRACPVANHQFDITRALTNDTPCQSVRSAAVATQPGCRAIRHVNCRSLRNADRTDDARTYYAFQLDGLLDTIRPLPVAGP